MALLPIADTFSLLISSVAVASPLCTVAPEDAGRVSLQEARDRNELEGYSRMDLTVPSGDHVAALSNFRRQMEGCSPEFQSAFLQLNRPAQAHLTELFFGPHPHRILTRADAAVPLIRFLGETGTHRELAIGTFSEGDKIHAILSLGETESVLPENEEDVFIAHTHPLTDHDIEEMFLPSDPDLSYFMKDALRYSRSWKTTAGAALAVYDPERNVYRNWIVSPYGASRTDVELAAENIFAGVRIFYAVRPGFEDDERVTDNLNQMRLDFRAYTRGRSYGTRFEFLPAESYASILDSMPRSLMSRRQTPERT